ncbi:patatin-like phospholipase family protein [Pseudoalteromonas sp. T1lg76]|uniref:patatin-like phospholipase family protein n=2 Tax=unclassified Pseudoalteromonas TaxID=194690 RepID=UPI000CF6BC12|nr:patatin-like phospholipase family protein [Pseudoalteromonas sp. T1lg76]
MSSFQETFNPDIENQEQQWLSDRRAAGNLGCDGSKDTKALAFSGGGIRSATFNLGVLQALAKNDQLKQFDYLSSVSGGSYIATSYTWFKSRFPGQFPFSTNRHDKRASDILGWLRAHSSFLTPGFGVDKSSLLTAILTGTLINMLIMVPVLLLLLFLLSYEFSTDISAIAIHAPFNGFSLLRGAGFITLIASFGLMLLTAISTGFESARANHRTETLRYYLSNLFPLGLAMLAFGYIPIFHKFFERFAEWLVHTSFSISLLGMLITRYAAHRNGSADIKYSLTSILIDLGLLLTCFGFVMISYHFAVQWELLPTLFYPLLILSVFLVLGCNINAVSMHGYYRDRLRDAFMPCHLSKRDTNDEQCEQTLSYDKQLLLGELKATDAPFPIINCNIELLGSTNAKYKNRGGDCFTLTPLYSGSDSTGYRATKDYMGGKLDLASACAISGAAIATNTPMTRSKQLNFIMSLLNLRLGCWLKNPNKPTKPANFFNKPWWYMYMFKDMFGQGLNEHQSYIHLSDGGHFENLACYELIRRKCKLIVCCDAGADPNYQFQDLARLIKLARVDFGAKLAIDVSAINQKAATSNIAWTEGKISYDDGSYGRFIYVKASMIQHVNEELKSYKRINPDFPHQSTSNQFFDEMQFEAYRELGFELTHQMLKSVDLATTATSGEQ